MTETLALKASRAMSPFAVGRSDDLFDVRPVNLEKDVCESLGTLLLLEAIVGADTFLRFIKLCVVGGFFDEPKIGAIEGLAPLLGDSPTLPRSLVVAYCTW
jgi:hypothetical protein